MSSGPFHYKRAERLVAEAPHEALVHATLAAAAAQIELAASMQADNGVSVEWLEAVT